MKYHFQQWIPVLVLVCSIAGWWHWTGQRAMNQELAKVESETTQESVLPTPSFAPWSDHSFHWLQIGDHQLQVEVVTSQDSITQGLSGRAQLGSDGMLFILPRDSQPSFWMKEMKFDLDIIWLKNFMVVDMSPNVPHPAPTTPLNALPRYKPSVPVDMVLELPAGSIERLGLTEGKGINLLVPSPELKEK